METLNVPYQVEHAIQIPRIAFESSNKMFYTDSLAARMADRQYIIITKFDIERQSYSKIFTN